MGVGEKTLEPVAKKLAGKRRSKRTSETPQGMWLGGARKGSLWLCYAKSLAGRPKRRISGNRGRPKPLPGRGTIGEVRRGGRRASGKTKEKAHRIRVIFGRERTASRLPCLSLGLGLGDDRRSTSVSGNVSLTIFITSISGSESYTCFTNRFFHFSGPPGFTMAFIAAKRSDRFDRIQCQRSTESSSRGKRKRRVFLRRRTVRVRVKSEVISTSFLKIKGRRTLVGAKDWRKRDD